MNDVLVVLNPGAIRRRTQDLSAQLLALTTSKS